ncbi:MAG TPA: hypothetical protein PLF92_02630 [Arenimonas sp.]|jgi:hypothetical protein|nr:hypothetical protein [Arenimonas sp.]HPO24166.1 hypothetical protein [Arenimonas sp.]HPW31783.1 hypothetical protein [Arenimonas sp.]
MKHIVIAPEISNREFLETYVGSARIGLCGGTEFINKAIRKLQWQVTADGRRSPWSHAFMFSERRSDGEFWVLESDLDFRHKQIRLGVQENRMSKYYDEAEYPNLAVIDFGLTPEQTKAVLTEGLNLLSGLSTYSLAELLGTLMSLSNTRLRSKENLLAREGALYCSAMVQHCFDAINFDLKPNVDTKNITPHDLFQTPQPHTAYHLIREQPKGPRKSIGQRMMDLANTEIL